MAGGQLTSVLAHLRRIIAGEPASERSDADLLGRFLDRRDADAFAQLVERHGPLVWNVCVRVLRHEHDAEDAFQATFLILARRARSIRKQPSLASWLYGVAYRTATRVKQRHKNERERAMNHATNGVATASSSQQAQNAHDASWQDLRPILDEEVNQLPEKYRTPVVLCYFEGQTNDEAARTLGWPKGTVAGRLARARDLLRQRLVRRGLAFSSAGLGSLIAANAATASMPAAFLSTIPPAALAFAAGKAAAGLPLLTEGARLAEGVMHAMFITKLRIATAICVGAVLLALGGGTIAYRAFGGDEVLTPTKGGNGVGLVQGGGVDKVDAQPKTEEEKLLGTWVLISRGEDPKLKGKPVQSFDKVIFTKDLFQFCFDETKHDYAWKIDATKSPRELDIIEKEATPGKAKQKPVPCIYKLDGDRLEIAMGDPGFRPNDFAKAGKFGQHFVLKREGSSSEKPKDEELLQGTWVWKALDADGKTVVEVKRLVFKGDEYWWYEQGRPHGPFKYRLDATKSPKHVDELDASGSPPGTIPLLDREPLYNSIYHLDNDTLRLGRHYGFATRPKDWQSAVVITYQREKAAEKPKTDEELIQGTWQKTRLSEATGKLLVLQTLVFKGQHYTVIQQNDIERGQFGFRLDSSKSPKQFHGDGRPFGFGQAIYSIEGNVLKIGESRRGSRFMPGDWDEATVHSYERVDKSEATTIPLRNTAASEVATILQQLFMNTPAKPTIVADARTNSLILQGTAKQLEEIKQILDKLDALGAKPPKEKPVDPTPPGTLTPRAREIVKEMIETAKAGHDLHNQQFRAGKGSADELCDSSRRIVNAHALDEQNRKEYLAALQAHVERMKEAEQVSKERFDAGRLTGQEYAAMKYARLEAELWLEREKGKPKGQEQGRIEIQRMRVAQAEANLAAKKERLTWSETMLKRGFLPKSEHVSAEADVRAAEIAIAEAKLELDRLLGK